MRETAERAGGAGTTDFGRALATQPTQSLAEAVREHARRKDVDEARRYWLTMGLIGYFAGLVVIVPAVVWLASGTAAIRVPFATSTADAARPPKLVSAPLLTNREIIPPPDTPPSAAADPAVRASASPEMPMPLASAAPPPAAPIPAPVEADPRGPLIETARALIDQGRLLEARRALTDPRLERVADAQFLLAETFDPNVLAAVGATGIQADVAKAERLYRLARDLGSALAIERLRALD